MSVRRQNDKILKLSGGELSHMAQPWVYGAIVLLVVLHGAALLYAYRTGQRQIGQPNTESAGKDVTGEGIECPDCGALNERGYRYCRQCVGELPVAARVLDEESAPRERETF